MKRVFSTLMILLVFVSFAYSQSIRLIKPDSNNYKKSDILHIVWAYSGIKGNVKIVLRKADGSGGTIIAKTYPIAKMFINYKLNSVLPGKYFVKIKQGKIFGKSRVFTVSENSSLNNNGTVVLAPRNRINNTAVLATRYQPVNTMIIKKDFRAFGKLIPMRTLADFGASVDIKIYFSNALKVRVYNKKTNQEVYSWANTKPESKNVIRTIKLNYIDNPYEMEVWGKNRTYIANCWIVAKPVVNEFRIEHSSNGRIVHYSFTGCKYAYLKKCSVGSNYWLRVMKLEGNLVRGTFTKKGTVNLYVSTNKKTKYALFLIGELKQGVVKSKEIVADFWTNQFIR